MYYQLSSRAFGTPGVMSITATRVVIFDEYARNAAVARDDSLVNTDRSNDRPFASRSEVSSDLKPRAVLIVFAEAYLG